jgi:hypothetical protein
MLSQSHFEANKDQRCRYVHKRGEQAVVPLLIRDFHFPGRKDTFDVFWRTQAARS